MSAAIEITGDASIWTLGYISHSNPLPPSSLEDPYTCEGSYGTLFKAPLPPASLRDQYTHKGSYDSLFDAPLPPASLRDSYTREGSYDSLFDAGSENGDRKRCGIMSDGLGLKVETQNGAGPSDNEFSEYEEANAARQPNNS